MVGTWLLWLQRVFIYIKIHNITLTRHISEMFLMYMHDTVPHHVSLLLFYYLLLFSIQPYCTHMWDILRCLFFYPSPGFSYYHNSSGRHSWTKAVGQMSGGPKSKMLFLCIFSMARETHAHWIILNGQTQNSTGTTSSCLREKAWQAITTFLRKSASNPFRRVY